MINTAGVGRGDPRRAGVPARRAGLVALALVGTGVLATGCGGRSSGPGVASVGKTATTASPSAAQSGSVAGPGNALLAYVNCMRSRGEPKMPEPTIDGRGVHLSVTSGSGVDPNSPQFTAANNACKHLLPNNGVPQGNSITAADQADYLKAAACMRSHGVPNFPDPTFQNNGVTFKAPGSRIDTNSSQYKSALATCQKLIPAGLPYSSTNGS